MHKPVLFAAMVAALPLGAGAQSAPDPAPTPPAPPTGCAAVEEAPRAASALPARATTRAAPELGAVAPNTRVPSHTLTPSMRAMRAARAKEARNLSGDPSATGDCAASLARPKTARDSKKN